jgi:N6-adenosine-specific RNA methylase IME4
MTERQRLLPFRPLQSHPLADIFPLLEGREFDELVEDIRLHGLHEQIVLHDDKILDGRNRYRACQEVGVAPQFKSYSGDDPLGYIISLNLKRRYLSESQRAMVAAKLARLNLGANQHSEGTSIEGASRLLNVGRASVERAKTVQRDGAPELVQAVERGILSVSAAADIATEPPEQQREVVAKGEREILERAKEIRARKAEQNHAARIRRLAEISANNEAMPTGRRFPVIYADPAWYFEVYDPVRGSERDAGSHYPCMRTEDICALPVAQLATDDAVLFLWTTASRLPEALRVIEAWGFRYVSNVCWVKDHIGLGYYVRNQHEILLIAMRGNMPTPLPAQRPPSVITAPRREHSRKPDEAYALIETMYPDLPKFELFARTTRAGWTAWGNEAPTESSGKKLTPTAPPRIELVPSTVCGTNADLIRNAARLHLADGAIVADVTFGHGVFWKKLGRTRFHVIGSDLREMPGASLVADCRRLPYADASIDVETLDLPYVHTGPNGHYLDDRYGGAATTPNFSHAQIIELYRDGMLEARRVLRPGGQLWVKTQDEIESGRQRRSHIEIYNIAMQLGFKDLDLFVLFQSSPIKTDRWRTQHHARKTHSYLWIFEQRGCG